MSWFWLALLFTSFAWLSTGIGSIIAFSIKKTNTNFLSISLGFSAWVMIYISFVELFSESKEMIFNSLWESWSWLPVISFFVGFGIIALIDKLIPNYENPHEMHNIEELWDKKEAKSFKKLYRIGILMALVITIHNIPEWLVTFLTTIVNIKLWIAIAVAIAIHNIPEWIWISIPIYYATGSKKKAFFYSFLSWLAEPIWWLICYLILAPFINDTIMWVLFAIIAGIMVFISFDTLLPSAQKYWRHNLAIVWLVSGMLIMAISLLWLC